MPIDAHLQARVQRLVAEYLEDPSLEGDVAAAPVAVRCGTAVLYVRLVDAAPPVVRVFSPLLRRLGRSPELLTELNELNARLNFQRVFWRDGTVYAAQELLAETLTAAELGHACDGVADAADYYDERLRARFGGETAFAERRPG
jgi:Putative bacterial sensory transduction regulator